MSDIFGDVMGMKDDYKDRVVGNWISEDGKSMVDTCEVYDGRKDYETAVQHPLYNDGEMVIVECYDDKEQALIGHEIWLALMQNDNLPPVLTDCANSEISQMCRDMGNQMEFPRKEL